jgi:uncharacterized protein YwqG
MSIAIIALFPTAFIGGVSYYPKNEEYPFDEYNVYLFLIQLQFRVYEKAV